ncbi:KdsC family phosphatase [Mitsuokella sp. oral taxon 131]|uniref:KdsC family phosphatase n=1 Tax=Mitsuokella sp. oral taxon 131 TaxID=1321780 RepID=UPI0003ADBBB5|nr:HAD hydrolase family protein [Mitsuokella sp. oral taxon 131]ERL04989.1 putative 3-deoxy-manno-octulosonate-8-phosphatase [Mitsuokella sp. oral taxon 131 str. W9106]
MEFRAEAIERAKRVQCVILDVDGVLTDGSIYIGETGECFKPFFCRDGLAITRAAKVGLSAAIITGRASKHVAVRAKELHIEQVYQGELDKRAAYRALKEKLRLSDDAFAYVGDDIVDLPIMLQVGFPVAVADAVAEVRETAQLITDNPGGRGAVRDAYEFILKGQGKWQRIINGFKASEDMTGIAQ